jgi:hypothetical protein
MSQNLTPTPSSPTMYSSSSSLSPSQPHPSSPHQEEAQLLEHQHHEHDKDCSIMDRSVRLNNAGVDCVEEGYHKIAWDLFKGSLELKLALERRSKPSSEEETGSPSTSSGNTEHMERTDNAYVQRAEEHLFYLEEEQMRRCEEREDGAFHNVEEERPSEARGPVATSTDLNGDGIIYTPFLYCHPIRLQTESSSAPRDSRRDSATIIFNLALVDQMKHRRSQQAVALYELAMTLLTGDPVDMLGIALVNNIGVWCCENGDEEGAWTCMGHLSNFVRAFGDFIGEEEREGLHSNILWLLNPPFAASPAA